MTVKEWQNKRFESILAIKYDCFTKFSSFMRFDLCHSVRHLDNFWLMNFEEWTNEKISQAVKLIFKKRWGAIWFTPKHIKYKHYLRCWTKHNCYEKVVFHWIFILMKKKILCNERTKNSWIFFAEGTYRFYSQFWFFFIIG